MRAIAETLEGGGDEKSGVLLSRWADVEAAVAVGQADPDTSGSAEATLTATELMGQTDETGGWDRLTPTERTVIALAVEGLTNPRIGERMGISPRTVQRHLSNIFRKLDVSSRTQLVVLAVRRTNGR